LRQHPPTVDHHWLASVSQCSVTLRFSSAISLFSMAIGALETEFGETKKTQHTGYVRRANPSSRSDRSGNYQCRPRSDLLPCAKREVILPNEVRHCGKTRRGPGSFCISFGRLCTRYLSVPVWYESCAREIPNPRLDQLSLSVRLYLAARR